VSGTLSCKARIIRAAGNLSVGGSGDSRIACHVRSWEKYTRADALFLAKRLYQGGEEAVNAVSRY
jgi:hypothetical protein